MFKALKKKADDRVCISDVKEKLTDKARKAGILSTETYIDYFLVWH